MGSATYRKGKLSMTCTIRLLAIALALGVTGPVPALAQAVDAASVERLQRVIEQQAQIEAPAAQPALAEGASSSTGRGMVKTVSTTV